MTTHQGASSASSSKVDNIKNTAIPTADENYNSKASAAMTLSVTIRQCFASSSSALAKRRQQHHYYYYVLIGMAVIVVFRLVKTWTAPPPLSYVNNVVIHHQHQSCHYDDSLEFRKFMVVTSQRSGSGWLVKLLDNHTSVTCGGEVLLKHKGLYRKPGVSVEKYANGIDYALKTLFQQQQQQPRTQNITSSQEKPWVGFKVMYGQGFLDHGQPLVEEWTCRGYKLIHLVRRNKLLQYFSAVEMKKGFSELHGGEVAHPEAPEQVEKLQHIKLDVTAEETIQALDARFQETATASNYLGMIGDVTTVYYEDLVDDTQAEMDRLFRFLQVPSQTVTSSLLKIHSEPRMRDYYVEDEKLRDRYYKEMSRSVYSYLLQDW